MRILVTNDDGIKAQGIKELVTALSSEAEVFVFAPDSQRSACGHGITVRAPIMVNEVDFPKAYGAWTLSGTPADCVKLGLRILKDEGVKVDFVYAGINHGSNLGTDTLYSGTVSGAIEGVINGIPSVALSVYNHNPEFFGPSRDMAIEALRIASGKIDKGTVLNINLPDAPANKIKGVKVTRLGAREYDEKFQPHIDEEGKKHYFYTGKPVIYSDLPEDVDVIALQNNFISITPLHYDLTNYNRVKEVKDWGFRYQPKQEK
ncbi:MAG: 5'/3'-nucleotidase SurE [Anaerovoracaceae bacterium]|jgi:5'-nucleotidase